MGLSAAKYARGNDTPEEENRASNAEKVNILIVDDLPEKILVYETILEDLNQNLISVRSGEEALKLLLKHEFAVILLDVNMPGIDGFETASLIQQRKKSAHIPIIFLTAFPDDINMNQGYASGAVDYLTTPVVPAILKTKVGVFIELFQMRQQAAFQAEERAKRAAAEDADRRKDEFLATLAHELRNPLAPLRNALHILQLPNIKQEMAAAACQLMERQLQHMVRLVDDLMDVSRITRGKIDLRMENVFLLEAIESAIETAQPLISERNHVLMLDIPDKTLQIRADIVRLSQVFTNLLNNAAKYTDPGGKITISAQRTRNLISVSIQDTGVGICAEKLQEIFNLFMQVDNSISRSQGGLGIGLTLAKNLVEMQGGALEAKSDGANKGSTFIVKMPVASTVTAITSKDNEIKMPAQFKVRNILIVDDNKASAQTMAWMLESMGHQTHLAYNGQSAVEMAKTLSPDMIFLDIGMPGMDGYEICKILRQEPNLANTVFVAQTGWGQAEHRALSKEAGFHHHLVKPVNMEIFQAILQH